MDADRRGRLVEATLAALSTPSGMTSTCRIFTDLGASRVGPVTFAELARAPVAIDVSAKLREWQEEWAELDHALRRAAERERRGLENGRS